METFLAHDRVPHQSVRLVSGNDLRLSASQVYVGEQGLWKMLARKYAGWICSEYIYD